MQVRLVGRRAADGVHAFDELPGLLPDTDHLVLAAPLTDATRGMLHSGRSPCCPSGPGSSTWAGARSSCRTT